MQGTTYRPAGNTISVAMCTFNGEKYLSEQLESIARQTLLPFELVICDDRSTDSTCDIVQKFAGSVPFPVHFYRNEKNLGSTRNFEKAISLCSGDWIALCDQDDIWYPQKLEALLGAFNAHPNAGGAFSDADLIGGPSKADVQTLWAAFGFNRRLQRRWQSGPDTVLIQQEVVTGATLMFRSRLRELLLPIPSLWIHDAWIAWIIAVTSDFVFVDSQLMGYRIHAQQQEGIPSGGAFTKLKRAFSSAAAAYGQSGRKYEELQSRLSTIRGPRKTQAWIAVRDKIKHLQFRANLPMRGVGRVCGVLVRIPAYIRYSRGLPEIVKDLLCA